MSAPEHSEQPIAPELPIVDAHHHLWLLPQAALEAMEQQHASLLERALAPTLRRHARYLFDELLADAQSGHNVRATLFVDAQAMYRADGPDRMKSVGEVEFVNGVAAMSASGLFGETRLCAGIVGGVDLRLGDALEEVLIAHIRAGGGRYRGVRAAGIAYDDDKVILGTGSGTPHVLSHPVFRKGFGVLHRLGLTFDVFLLEPQLPELIDLAQTFPETTIILNHLGCPLGVGRYAGKRDESFPIWRSRIQALARCPNVLMKLGGLGIPLGGFSSYGASPPMTSTQLAEEWKPYVETAIEALGANRCMFESNFPVDAAVANYTVLWNAFKRLAAGASDAEKEALFSGTATRAYRLNLAV